MVYLESVNKAYDVLVVDDEPRIRTSISDTLKDAGYNTRLAGSSTEAIDAVRMRMPSLVILDVWLGHNEVDGIKVLQIIKSIQPAIPVLMISGHGNIETAVLAIKEGAYDFIEKPFEENRLLISVQRAIESARLKRENTELRGHINSMLIGNSAGMTALRNSIIKVAPKSSRVFITGGVGVGKETVAREIHALSPRNQGGFLVLNCAMIQPEYFELKLFGCDIAGRTSIGLLEQAHGGTLYLEEVTDIPYDLQAKFVQALEKKSFFRLGGEVEVHVDVRIIASSSRDIAHSIENNLLREDLYFRLNVVPIEVPALADRPDDLHLLADYFLDKIATNCNVPVKKISKEALITMQTYKWPGNVRQLRNVIEWLLIMHQNSESDVITNSMLPPEIINGEANVVQSVYDCDIMSLSLKEARRIFEKRYVAAQLTRFSNNITKAAEHIKMDRSALHRKLNKLKFLEADGKRGNAVEDFYAEQSIENENELDEILETALEDGMAILDQVNK